MLSQCFLEAYENLILEYYLTLWAKKLRHQFSSINFLSKARYLKSKYLLKVVQWIFFPNQHYLLFLKRSLIFHPISFCYNIFQSLSPTVHCFFNALSHGTNLTDQCMYYTNAFFCHVSKDKKMGIVFVCVCVWACKEAKIRTFWFRYRVSLKFLWRFSEAKKNQTLIIEVPFLE